MLPQRVRLGGSVALSPELDHPYKRCHSLQKQERPFLMSQCWFYIDVKGGCVRKKNQSLGVSYQEETSVAVACSVLYVGESLSSQRATGDVQGLCQGQVVLGVHQQTQVGAENPSDCHFHLWRISGLNITNFLMTNSNSSTG